VTHTWTWASSCLALWVLTVPVPSAGAAEPGETLLPATTKGFVSITDRDELIAHWDKTQMGQLMQDPGMKPFADDIQRQLMNRLYDLDKRLGMTWDDLDGVPGGELSMAFIQVDDDQAAVALVIDVTGHQEEAKALLEKITKKMAEQKAKESKIEVSGTPGLLFELPKEERAAEDGLPRQTIYVLTENLLLGSDNLDVIKGILARVAGAESKTLADVPAFQNVIERCQKDAGDLVPQIRWFVEPFGYARAAQATASTENRARGKTTLEQLEATGFASLQGMGGFANLSVEGYEFLHRTAVYAPKPWEKSMQMLVFPNTAESKPPSWVPRDLASCTVVYCDLLGAFDNFGPLFDEVVGEGEEGIWIDVLKSLKEDEDGPQIDLREELFKHLGPQVIVITDYELPITPASERLLFAVATKDPDAVAKAIEKTLKDDEEIRRREFEGPDGEKHVIWEVIPRKKAEVERVELNLPPLGLVPEVEVEEEGEPLLPNGAFTVAHGYLLVASHYDFLLTVLRPIEKREALGRSIDFLVVEDKIKTLAPETQSIRGFSRTDEDYRPTYELIRQGKMPESQTALGRMLNSMFPADEPGATRTQELDGSKLPEFEFVRRHLGPAGAFVTSEEDGWFVKGFVLPKESR